LRTRTRSEDARRIQHAGPDADDFDPRLTVVFLVAIAALLPVKLLPVGFAVPVLVIAADFRPHGHELFHLRLDRSGGEPCGFRWKT
jgi:hypothetical protein